MADPDPSRAAALSVAAAPSLGRPLAALRSAEAAQLDAFQEKAGYTTRQPYKAGTVDTQHAKLKAVVQQTLTHPFQRYRRLVSDEHPTSQEHGTR